MSGRITAIEPQARHANRFNLYLDDKFAMGVSAIVAAKLRVGQVLDDAASAALARAEAYETAHEQALRYLERDAQQRRVEAAVAQEAGRRRGDRRVIARLTEAGLLDDTAFAKYWVENRETFGRALDARSVSR